MPERTQAEIEADAKKIADAIAKKKAAHEAIRSTVRRTAASFSFNTTTKKWE